MIRKKITVSYRVIDESGKTLDIIKETGYNKRYLRWKVERRVSKKYGKRCKPIPLKVVEDE
jgi:hypothetical protein